MAAGDITKLGIPGVLLTTSFAVIYTIPASQIATQIEIDLCNIDASVNVSVEIQFVPSGGSPADTYKVVSDQSLTSMVPGESRGYGWNRFLTAGYTIQAKASVASKVSCQAGIILESL
jgi:hypothetical protein